MLYNVKVPPTKEQGSYSTQVRPAGTETLAAAALWDYNSARAHDGLPPLRRMPRGTSYTPARTWVIQGQYPPSQEWEDETEEGTRPAALERLKEYRENMPSIPHRILPRRIE